jgi:protoporphyrinogen oxidase
VQEAARKLKYRDFLIVTLMLDHADPFPDNWIYIHEPKVKVGRIQNFRAWSQEMVPDPEKASIGMEYFCNEDDPLWSMSNADLVKLAGGELERLGLAAASTVVDGTVIRQPKAYPVYDGEYKDALDTVAEWLGTFGNFQTVGRNGLHRYNNQDHSMLTAMLAARNILGEKHDVWTVNVERSYHEEFQLAEKSAGRKADGAKKDTAGQLAA